jgi:hypothetical protein
MSSLSPILDVIIGLIGVYIAFSLLASWLQERVATALKLRSKGLINGIYQLLNGNTTAFTEFVNDPMFQALRNATPFTSTAATTTSAGGAVGAGGAAAAGGPAPADAASTTTADLHELGKTGPSYLSKEQFSSIFMNLVAKHGAADAIHAVSTLTAVNHPVTDPVTGQVINPAADAAKQFAAAVQTAATTLQVGPQLNGIVAKAGGDYNKFVGALEDWYDDHMDRVSGWYKRESQWILLLLGLGLAIFFNVDSVRLYAGLSCNSALRGATAIAASKGTADSGGTFVSEMLNAIPLGWRWPVSATNQLQTPDEPIVCTPANSAPFNPWSYWLTKILGIVITVFALSLGAPFWFDALSCITNVRAAGKKPADAKTS